ncbi:MAG: hypothetical protein EOM91_17710 [Sphingobacteriia bacterium]|nr:hypothetical protein [Sphingobacteriia bacterium]NCC41312.1 hypothetical protein [Gammaproteobacteria bacterium]
MAIAHVQRDLGAHHSPDLFHLQQAVGQALTLPLARAVAQAETDEASAKAAWNAARAANDAHALPPWSGSSTRVRRAY